MTVLIVPPAVRLICVSQPVVDDVQTSDQLLAFFARVSNTANQLNHETGPKLLRYLVRNKEWSPFEMVSATVEIITTRDIARQMQRHRSFSFQEFSQRYAAAKLVYSREARLQDPDDRQNSLDLDLSDANHADIGSWWTKEQARIGLEAHRVYVEALNNGVAKEVARAILPEGLTQTKLYMAGTLRSWIHYTAVRTKPATQKEHREIAWACWAAIVQHFTSIPEFA